MSGISGSVADRWQYSDIRADNLPDLLRQLNFQMAALSRSHGRVQERLENGPVPGAFFPVQFHVPGTLVPLVDAARVSFRADNTMSFKPVWVTGIIARGGAAGASMEFVVNYMLGGSYTPLHNTVVATLDGGGVFSRDGFLTDSIFNDFGELSLSLDISTDNLGPEDLTVMVMFKNMGRVAPI